MDMSVKIVVVEITISFKYVVKWKYILAGKNGIALRTKSHLRNGE